MTSRWSLIVADFRREYQLTPDALAALSFAEFGWLLTGLSDTARWRTAWTNAPKHLHNPDDVDALTASLRR